MKKVYITPSFLQLTSDMAITICAGSPANASGTVGGGGDGTSDQETTGSIDHKPGSSLEGGSKGSFSSWDDED